MRRKTLDALLASTGAVIALVLLAAGGLLTWANTYIDGQVTDQLSMQDITMPAKDSLETKAQHDALDQYAGQKMTDGDQAKAFAEHYILVHMNASSEGRTTIKHCSRDELCLICLSKVRDMYVIILSFDIFHSNQPKYYQNFKVRVSSSKADAGELLLA